MLRCIIIISIYYFAFAESLMANDTCSYDTIYVVCKGVEFNDSTFMSSENFHVYKKRKNVLFTNMEKKGKRKAVRFLWDTNNYPYFIFVYKKVGGKRIEEGYWDIEAWRDGYFKHYSNGVIESEGVYVINEKVGTWYYYDKNGKMIKKEDYPDEKKDINTHFRYPNISLNKKE